MTRNQAIKLLRGGPKGIVKWNSMIRTPNFPLPNLSGADLSDLRAEKIVFPLGMDLHGASLANSNLSDCFFQAAFDGVNFSGAILQECQFFDCDATRADFTQTHIFRTEFEGGYLCKARFRRARFAFNLFTDIDLAAATGLRSVAHHALSSISTRTLAASRGRIPEKFLRGCGLTPWEAVATKLYDPTLTPEQIADLQYKIFDLRAHSPIYLGGVFVSYSRKDAKFVDRIHDALMEKGANVWLDRQDMIAGPLRDQVRRAVSLNDTLLLVLSKASIESDWVEYELEKARETEQREGRSVLCPGALDDTWKAKMDHPLWRQVKKNNVLDFAKWRSADAFDAEFAKLIKGLKIYYPPKKKRKGSK